MTFKKLPARYFSTVLPLIVSIFMSCLVSGVATFRGIGFADDFVHTWMTSWGMSWIIAYPCLQIVMPTARRIALLFVEAPKT